MEVVQPGLEAAPAPAMGFSSHIHTITHTEIYFTYYYLPPINRSETIGLTLKCFYFGMNIVPGLYKLFYASFLFLLFLSFFRFEEAELESVALDNSAFVTTLIYFLFGKAD